MPFQSVAYKDLGTVPAQVNRLTGELFINPSIWRNLPKDHREFILLHESGHLELMTADEYRVNKYAIGKYLEAGQLNDEEFGRKLVILSEVLGDNGRELMNNEGNLSNFEPITAILGIFSIGSSIIGKKNAANDQIEFMEQQKLQYDIANAGANINKAKTYRTLIVVGSILILLILLYFILKK